MSDANLITLEGGDGAPVDLPPAFAPATEPPPVADPVPAEPVAATPPVAPATPPVEPAEPEHEDDPTDPRYTGVVKALRETRQKLGTLKGTNATLEAEAKAGRELAQLLQARPDVVAMLRGQPTAPAVPAVEPPKAPEPPAVPDHELRDLAESLGLYTNDGKPDVNAARRVHTHNERVARTIAEQAVASAVAPLRQHNTQTAAQAMRTQALDTANRLGLDAAIATPIIDGIMQTNPEMLADPQTATTTLLLAAGMQYVRQRHSGGTPTATPPAAPVVTPPVAPPVVVSDDGARQTGPPVMSALEQQAAKRAGVTPKNWQGFMGALTNSRPNAKPGEGFWQIEGDE